MEVTGEEKKTWLKDSTVALKTTQNILCITFLRKKAGLSLQLHAQELVQNNTF